ncbi:MAG: RNA polymerase sigma factor [Bacteroidales bacterium]|nr:RNA polymerase sigma factor [Bacteroidales bacterium]
MPEFNEKKIIEDCLKNDRVAQKALYDQYKTKMYTLAYRITNNFDDANDVLQDGFMEVFTNLNAFRGQSKLGTWVHTIIARVAIKKIRNKIHFEEIPETQLAGSVVWQPDMDIKALEKAIAELPEGYRSIFTLYEVEGFKHREIADMLEISENTSKSQLHKAKHMLIKKLGELR